MSTAAASTSRISGRLGPWLVDVRVDVAVKPGVEVEL